MSINIEGKEKRLGLALSGGGFRAAGFHLGVFKKLHSLGLLWKVDLLSCVSGGSIAGAFLASRWGDDAVLDELEELLLTTNVDVKTVLSGMLNPFESRTESLSDEYQKVFFQDLKLSDLSSGPRLYLNSTNLATGNMFSFVTGANEASELGEVALGRVAAPDFKVTDAVAASSAFPPVYPPFKLGKEWYPTSEVDHVNLTDGGIYDNLGVNGLLFHGQDQIDYAIVSDAGKPFDVDKDPTGSGVMVLKASIGILMEHVRLDQLSRLRLAHEAGKGPVPAVVSIDSSEGALNTTDAAKAAEIATRLKKLEPNELSLLIRHSGALVENRIKHDMSEILS